MIENVRANELFKKYVISPDMADDEISDLSLEELAYIYAAIEKVKKDEKFKNIYFPIRQQIFYWAVIEALKKAPELFIAHTKVPSYPYLDPGRNVWIFSSEETARKMIDHVNGENKVELIVLKAENKAIVPMFTQLYYFGVEQVILDQGSFPVALKRADVLPDPEWNSEMKDRQVINGKLQSSMIQLMQQIQVKADYEDKTKILTVLEARAFYDLVDAKFMVPLIRIVDGKPIKAGDPVPEGKEVKTAIPKLMNPKDQSQVIPAFTDAFEFARLYKPTDWMYAVHTYDNLMKFVRNNEGAVVINPKGTAFRINAQVLERLDAFKLKKQQMEASQAGGKQESSEKTAPAKQEAPKPSPADENNEVTYGDLIEEPDKLMAVLKKTAKASKVVRKMWLAQRIEGDKTGYLLVVDSNTDSSEIIAKLKEEAAAYLDGKELECRGADPSALSHVKNIKPFYKKGIFG